jgi:hypothetical protein
MLADIPQGFGIEGHHDRQHQRQRAEGEQARLHHHLRQAGHLDDGDQDADHQHLGHAPAPRRPDRAQQMVEARRPVAGAQRQRHIQQRAQFHRRQQRS